MKIKILTKKGLENAQSNLRVLEQKLKDVLAQKGEAAETGGNVWHDNFAFEDLIREEQMLKSQINDLKQLIKDAEIVEEDAAGEIVGIGSRVILTFNGEKQKSEYQITGLMESNPQENRIAYDSPLGNAILGAHKGEIREFIAGKNKKLVQIIDIK